MSALKRYKFLFKNFNSLPPEMHQCLSGGKAPDQLLRCICEICHNIIKRNIKLNPKQYKKLVPYKRSVKLFSNQSVSTSVKRNKLKNLSGKGFLSILAAIVAPILGSIITRK